jgi:hypothetical protein
MKESTSDAIGCIVWVISGTISVVAGFLIARWAASHFGNWYWVGGAVVFIVATTVISMITFGLCTALASLFLKDKPPSDSE